MLTQTKNKSKLKHFGISAIMKNKKLSLVLDDAFKSSPGSTKRAKAVAMIKSLNRVADGMGGPITNATQVPWLMNKNTSVNSTPITPVATPVVNKVTPENASKLSPELMNQYYGAQPTPKIGPTNIFPAAPVKITQANIPSPSNATKLDLLPEVKKMYEESGTPLSDEYKGLTEQLTSGTGSDVSNFIDQWYSKLDIKDQEKYKFLKEAVQSGIGPETFAIQVQMDKNKLKSLLPEVPENELPEGASLSRQISDLDTTLRKEYQVDVLQNNVKKLENRGVTIKQDLNDYIAARDEYLNKLDTMIGGAKESMAKMDMANPYISKRMNQYMNYLYIMKGRQQKRYTDYVKDSIDQNDLRLNAAKDNYNTVYKQYEDKLKTQTNITTEDYNSMRKMLEEMYTNLDKREEDLYNINIKKENYVQEQYNTLKTIADAVNDVSGGNLTDAERVSSQKNYLVANPKATIADWNNLSFEEKVRWLEKSKTENFTAAERDIIGTIEMKKSKGKPISDIENYIISMGYKPKDFWDYYKDYSSESNKKWYESDWVGKIPFVK